MHKNSKKHAENMKIRKTSRLFEAHLGIFSGLVDQGLVARCVRVLQYQLSSTTTCQKRKGTTKSKPWEICHFLSHDNKCKLPFLIGWLHARSAWRNFCLTIASNSWLVKVSQYDINVWVFLVGVALCVYAGVLERCDAVAFFASFLFFCWSFLFSFFLLFVFLLVFIFIFSICSNFSIFSIFHFFIFSIF